MLLNVAIIFHLIVLNQFLDLVMKIENRTLFACFPRVNIAMLCGEKRIVCCWNSKLEANSSSPLRLTWPVSMDYFSFKSVADAS